jgi:hypothetical protein
VAWHVIPFLPGVMEGWRGSVRPVPAPSFSIADRRARLARRHLLAPGGCPVAVPEVADALVALHSTDPPTVYLSVWARSPGVDRAEVDRALYDERSLVRILGMRRTMFVVTLAAAPLLDRACARPLAEGERRRSVKMLADAGIVDDPERWFDRVAEEALAALHRLGEATAIELTREVPDLATKIPIGAGTRWAGSIGVSTRVLFLLATRGDIVRGRPRGSWLSSQYRWSPVARWVDIPPFPGSDEEAAAELVRRYLARFGPVTETDVAWWTGWTKAKTRAALGAVGAVEVDIEGVGAGLVAPGDTGMQDPVGPWVALLPALDPTIMGWKERSWYLGEHGPLLFDTNGNAGPTVWVDGRVVGGWGQREGGEVVFRLLEDVGSEASEAVAARAARLTGWLGASVTSRFPAPLQRELAGGG